MKAIVVWITILITLSSCTDKYDHGKAVYYYINTTGKALKIEVYDIQAPVSSPQFEIEIGSFDTTSHEQGEFAPFALFNVDGADSVSIIWQNDRFIEYTCFGNREPNCNKEARNILDARNFEYIKSENYYYLTETDYNNALPIPK